MCKVSIILICALTFAELVASSTAQPPEIRDGGNYIVRSVANKNYLTVREHGIVGLRTGQVHTSPRVESMTQGWTLTWEPLLDKYQGYWIQSRYEYLNSVTAYYPPGTMLAEINVWKLKYLGEQKWQIQNARTKECLQVGASGRKNTVSEGECLDIGAKDYSRQQWNLIRVIVVPEEEEVLFRTEKL